MTSGTVQKGPLLRVGLGVMVVFLGLCTVFALVVTVGEAWQEHRQAQWPEVMARVDECGMVQTRQAGVFLYPLPLALRGKRRGA